MVRSGFLSYFLRGFFYSVSASLTKIRQTEGSMTLDGSEFLKTSAPGDTKLYNGLTTMVKRSPVVLEAPGVLYSEYARISSFTGLPTNY